MVVATTGNLLNDSGMVAATHEDFVASKSVVKIEAVVQDPFGHSAWQLGAVIRAHGERRSL